MAGLPPQNTEAEKSLLGAVLLNHKTFSEILPILKPDDFYEPAHGLIYSIYLNLYNQNAAIDSLTLISELENRGVLGKAKGKSYIVELTDLVHSSAHAIHHARLVKEASTRRKMFNISSEIHILSQGGSTLAEALDKAQSLILGLGDQRSEDRLRPMEEVAKDTFNYIASILGKEHEPGVPTAVPRLDKMTGGLQKNDLVIIAARPSVGKTAFSIQIALEAIKKRDISVLIFSLEMDARKICMRMLAYEAMIDLHSLSMGHIDEEDLAKCTEAAETLTGTPLWLDDSSDISVMEIKAKCRRVRHRIASLEKEGSKKSPPLGLVIVDYIQLIRATEDLENRAQQVAAISRNLKALAKELDLPVIAVSQLNRESEKRRNSRPILSDLRESGAIEQDADLVLLLHRPNIVAEEEVQKGEGEIIVAKHRNGPTGAVRIDFQAAFGRFYQVQDVAWR